MNLGWGPWSPEAHEVQRGASAEELLGLLACFGWRWGRQQPACEGVGCRETEGKTPPLRSVTAMQGWVYFTERCQVRSPSHLTSMNYLLLESFCQENNAGDRNKMQPCGKDYKSVKL